MSTGMFTSNTKKKAKVEKILPEERRDNEEENKREI